MNYCNLRKAVETRSKTNPLSPGCQLVSKERIVNRLRELASLKVSKKKKNKDATVPFALERHTCGHEVVILRRASNADRAVYWTSRRSYRNFVSTRSDVTKEGARARYLFSVDQHSLIPSLKKTLHFLDICYVLFITKFLSCKPEICFSKRLLKRKCIKSGLKFITILVLSTANRWQH